MELLLKETFDLGLHSLPLAQYFGLINISFYCGKKGKELFRILTVKSVVAKDPDSVLFFCFKQKVLICFLFFQESICCGTH